MHHAVRIAATVACLAAATATAASAAPALSITHCSQIKNGPYTAYTSALGHQLKGRTWTVAVHNQNPTCALATKLAPSLLAWWAKAKIADATVIQGYSCSKNRDRGYSGKGTSSGGAACIKGSAYFSIQMTGPYTLAQLKRLFGG
jgi:hypothetical protein